MAKLYNLARMSTTTTGTGPITLAAAISGFLSFSDAGVADGDVVGYAIQDGTASEIGYGTYTASGTTLTRTVRKSTNSDLAINLSGGAQVIITPSAEDFSAPDNVESINSGPIAGFRNAIINGSMVLSQRGAGFTSATNPNNNDGTYLLDRWVLLSDGNDIVDVGHDTSDVPTNGLYACKLNVQTISKKFGILQVIEQKNCIGLIGKTVTLSFAAKVSNASAGRLDNIKAVILSWNSTADSVTRDVVSTWNAEDTTPNWATNWTAENTPVNLSVTTSWATYSVSASIDTSATKNIAVFIWADGLTGTVGDTLSVTDVQLEPGSTATTFERRPFSLEAGLCYRYYFRPNVPAGAGVANATSSVTRFTTPFPVPMRIGPTVSWSGVGFYDGTSAQEFSSVNGDFSNLTYAQADISCGGSGFTAGRAVVAYNYTGSAAFSASAEL